MTVNQRQIAKELGISVSTVSLALRGEPRVSSEMQNLVRNTASKLGYTLRVQTPIESPKSGDTPINHIKYISMSSPNSDVFYDAVLSGAESVCWQKGLTLSYSQLKELSPYALEQYSQSDALMIVGFVDKLIVQTLKTLQKPIVLVDNNLPELQLDRILIENVGSVYQVVCRLAQQGHQRIAFLQGPDNHSSFRERRIGYLTAIEDLGFEVIYIQGGPAAYQISEAEKSMSQWLDANGKPNFTALVCCNDNAAIGTIHAFEERNIKVPKDVSIVGFDDIVMAQNLRPALSTVHVFRQALGTEAVKQLIARANNMEAPTKSLVLDTLFMERSTTR